MNGKKAIKKSERNNPVKKSIRIRKAKAAPWNKTEERTFADMMDVREEDR